MSCMKPCRRGIESPPQSISELNLRGGPAELELPWPRYSRDEITRLRRDLRERNRARCPRLAAGNFESVTDGDLELVFAHYDRLIFAGRIREVFGDSVRLRFNRSHSGIHGKCVRRERLGRMEYTIFVNAQTLWNNFRDGDRAVVASGVPCRDRLDGMQVILEHELVHLVELKNFGKSDCSAARYLEMASEIFGHSPIDGSTDFISHVERAAVDHGIVAGMRVRFTHEGCELRGLVRRVGKRATVIVEDPGGRHVDRWGTRFAKYYVPLEMLRREEG